MDRWCPREEMSLTRLPKLRHTSDLVVAADVDKKVMRKKIEEAMLASPKGKAPGLSGLSASLFQYYWHIVVISYFEEGVMPQSWKATYVVLIPNVKSPTAVSHLRSISLCYRIYMVIIRVLVNRLKSVIGSLVSLEQAAFISGRSIFFLPRIGALA